jgi:hypothetical protein
METGSLCAAAYSHNYQSVPWHRDRLDSECSPHGVDGAIPWPNAMASSHWHWLGIGALYIVPMFQLESDDFGMVLVTCHVESRQITDIAFKRPPTLAQ